MPRFIDLTGKKIGRLLVLNNTGKRNVDKKLLWKCRCDCGKHVEVPSAYLVSGHTRSCGCLKKTPAPPVFKTPRKIEYEKRKAKITTQQIIDSYIKDDLNSNAISNKYKLSKEYILSVLKDSNISELNKKYKYIGTNFGELLIKNIVLVSGRAVAVCLCSCGKELTVSLTSVLSENTKSCGCYKIKRTKEVMTGRTVSQLTRDKQSLVRKGKMVGKDNPNWKGGISSKNHLIRTSEKTNKWRLIVFKRDWFLCKKCNYKGNQLVAHHILNFKDHENLRFEPKNGITLCRNCHIRFHKTYGNKNNSLKQIKEFLCR